VQEDQELEALAAAAAAALAAPVLAIAPTAEVSRRAPCSAVGRAPPSCAHNIWWCTPAQEDALEALAAAALPLPGMAELLTMDPKMLEVSGCGFG
jgi:hypothetical protein